MPVSRFYKEKDLKDRARFLRALWKGTTMTRRRRHHNNDGREQKRSGSARRRLRRIAERMDVPFINDHPELGGDDGQDN